MFSPHTESKQTVSFNGPNQPAHVILLEVETPIAMETAMETPIKIQVAALLANVCPNTIIVVLLQTTVVLVANLDLVQEANNNNQSQSQFQSLQAVAALLANVCPNMVIVVLLQTTVVRAANLDLVQEANNNNQSQSQLLNHLQDIVTRLRPHAEMVVPLTPSAQVVLVGRQKKLAHPVVEELMGAHQECVKADGDIVDLELLIVVVKESLADLVSQVEPSLVLLLVVCALLQCWLPLWLWSFTAETLLQPRGFKFSSELNFECRS